MSSRTMRDHLTDILVAIEWIERFIGEYDLQTYVQDELVKSAVERKFEILSEAAYRIGDEVSQVSDLHDWEGLRGMGNILRHAHHRVFDEVVWDAIQNDLPALKRSASSALQRLSQDPPR